MAHLTPRRMAEVFGVLHNRELRALWFAEWISDAGAFISAIALAVYIHQLTGSAVAVGLVLAIESLPWFTVGPFLGVLTDRLDRRSVLIACDLSRAGLVALLPFTTQASQAYVLALLVAFFAPLFRPARSALLPQVAPGAELVPALAVLETTHQVLHTIGPALGGLAVLLLGPRNAFFLDSVSFLVSTAFILRLRRRGRPDVPEDRSAVRELTEGFAAVARQPAARAYALLTAAVYLGFSGIVALLVTYVHDSLGKPAGSYGLVLGAAGLGTVLASLAIAARDDHHPRTPWAWAAAVSLSTFLLSAADPSFLALLPIAFLAGISDAGISIPMSATLAEALPDEVRGRAYGAINALVELAGAVGALGFAWLGERIGVALGMSVAAASSVGFGVLVLLLGGARAIAGHERERLAAARDSDV